MTRAGKILLYANLVLSLIMAAWGMALFSGRVNWTDKSPPDAVQGEYKKLTEKIAGFKPVVAAAMRCFRPRGNGCVGLGGSGWSISRFRPLTRFRWRSIKSS